MSKIIHIVEVIADPMSVPYFNLFADFSTNHPEIKLSFICLSKERPPMLDDMKMRNCDCYWVNYDYSKRFKSWIKSYIALKKLFTQIKPNVVHSHLFDDGVPSMLAAKHANIKKRIHTKGCTTFNWFNAPKAVLFDKLINRCATHIIAISSESKKFIIDKEKASPSKIHLIHHGVSFKDMQSASVNEIEEFKTKFSLHNKRIIGTVSRYIDWKGYKKMITAASSITKKFPDTVFIGIGSGPQENELRELIKEQGLQDKFILTGWIEKKYIPAVFKSLDIYIHAAFMEPFGFVIPEAMVNKIPIVTTPTGSGLDGLIHMESGYIAPYNDINEFEKGIEYFLTTDSKAFTDKAYQSAIEKFTFDKMWDNHLKLYLS